MKKSFDWNLHTEYADDIDWLKAHFNINKNLKNNKICKQDILKKELNEINTNLLNSFTSGNLKLNLNKTESYFLSNPINKDKLSIKKLGSLLNANDDIIYRINCCASAFKNLYKCWNNYKYITINTKIRLYNVFVKPILLYNTFSITASCAQLNKLNSLHRKHLRIIFGIFYPNFISNKELYLKSNSISITDQIFKSRWKYLGKVLNEKINHPAFILMKTFYQLSNDSKSIGRRITLQKQLSRDLHLINLSLENLSDFEFLINKATENKNWKIFVDELYLKYLQQQQLLEETLLVKRKNYLDNKSN